MSLKPSRMRPPPAITDHYPKRTESRARVAMEAKVVTVSGRATGFVLNVSCHGAMVQTAEPPSQGSSVVLKCGPLDELGKVAWVEQGRIGIEFDEPVSEDLVVELRQLADETIKNAPPRCQGRGLCDTASHAGRIEIVARLGTVQQLAIGATCRV